MTYENAPGLLRSYAEHARKEATDADRQARYHAKRVDEHVGEAMVLRERADEWEAAAAQLDRADQADGSDMAMEASTSPEPTDPCPCGHRRG